MDIDVTEMPKFSDERGFLVEFLKSVELDNKQFGQIYLATLKPGGLRGNHFHRDKSEWLCIVQGKARIALEHVETKERKELELDAGAEKIVRVKIPPNVAHAIKNVSQVPLVIVAYTDRLYNPKTVHQEHYLVIK
jgi:dTDP-4-dehydrorhamnose 3,5-epimerase-like enzyme